MKVFKFDLNQEVTIDVSGEFGSIIARAEYESGSPDQYLIRYKCADGRAVEAWWNESSIS